MPFDFVDDALSGQFADVTRRRSAAGAYVNRRFVAGAETTATIRASVQPVTGDEQEDLPDAVLSRGGVHIVCKAALQPLDERTLQEEDRIDWNGEVWHVLKVERWQVGGMDHYEGLAARAERV